MVRFTKAIQKRTLYLRLVFYIALSHSQSADIYTASSSDCTTSFLDGNHERQRRRRQKYVRQSESSRTCNDHSSTIVCAYTHAIIAHGEHIGGSNR